MANSVGTYIGAGAYAAGTGALTVAMPSGITQGDVLLLFVESANQAVATPSGWSSIAAAGIGTAAAAAAVRLQAFYKIAGASEGSVSVADSGNHTSAVVHAIRTPIDYASDNYPIQISSTATVNVSTTSVSCPAVTTNSKNCLIINAVAHSTDTDVAQFSGWANSNLTNLAEISNNSTSQGGGGGIGVCIGELDTPGNTGNTTATLATAATQALITIVIEPPPDANNPTIRYTSYNYGTADVTVSGFSSSEVLKGDLLILAVETANQAVSTPAGWTAITSQGTGTAGGTSATGLALFYTFATANGTPSSVTVTDPGDHCTAAVMVVRNADPINPIASYNGSVVASASLPISCPTITTDIDESLVINLFTNSVASPPSSLTNADLADTGTANVSNLYAAAIGTGNVGTLCSYAGYKAVAGSVAATTGTFVSSGTQALITLAINPIYNYVTIVTPTTSTSQEKSINAIKQLPNGDYLLESFENVPPYGDFVDYTSDLHWEALKAATGSAPVGDTTITRTTDGVTQGSYAYEIFTNTGTAPGGGTVYEGFESFSSGRPNTLPWKTASNLAGTTLDCTSVASTSYVTEGTYSCKITGDSSSNPYVGMATADFDESLNPSNYSSTIDFTGIETLYLDYHITTIGADSSIVVYVINTDSQIVYAGEVDTLSSGDAGTLEIVYQGEGSVSACTVLIAFIPSDSSSIECYIDNFHSTIDSSVTVDMVATGVASDMSHFAKDYLVMDIDIAEMPTGGTITFSASDNTTTVEQHVTSSSASKVILDITSLDLSNGLSFATYAAVYDSDTDTYTPSAYGDYKWRIDNMVLSDTSVVSYSLSVTQDTATAVGQTITEILNRNLKISNGTSTGLGQDILLRHSYVVSITPAFSSGVGQNIDVWTSAIAEPGSLSLTGYSAAVSTGSSISSPLGVLTLEGKVPLVSIGSKVSAEVGSIHITSYNAIVNTGTSVFPSNGELSLSYEVPVVSAGVNVKTPVGSLTFNTYTHLASTGILVNTATGTLVLTGYDASQASGATAKPTLGNLTLDSYIPITSGGASAQPLSGNLVLTGLTPKANTAAIVKPLTSSMILTAYDATQSSGANIKAVVGELTLAGITDVIISSGASAFQAFSAHLSLNGFSPTKVFAKPHGWIETLNGRNIEEVFIILLTLSHPSLSEDIRVTNEPLQELETIDSRGVISNSLEYVYVPFELVLPNLEQDTVPTSKASIDNVSREIIQVLSDITSPPSCKIQIVLSTDPDMVEYSVDGLKLSSAPYTELTIEAEFTMEYFFNEPYPSVRFTPSRFPGLFRGRSVNTSV